MKKLWVSILVLTVLAAAPAAQGLRQGKATDKARAYAKDHCGEDGHCLTAIVKECVRRSPKRVNCRVQEYWAYPLLGETEYCYYWVNVRGGGGGLEVWANRFSCTG